jgi:outer membrane protein TolC
MSLADFITARDAFSVSAALSFNADAWIPNSRKDLELTALRETEERLARAYEQARRNARLEVEGLLLDLEQSRAALGVATDQVALSERIYARTREAYERGSATALELEDAQYSVDTARQALVSGRYQYLALLIDLGYALGVDWRTMVR